MSELFFADMVRETSVGTGTGPLALAGAVPGFRGFADTVPPDAAFPYAIRSVTRRDQWETGIATIDGAGRLVRNPASSSNDGAAVDFAQGLKTVVLTVASGWLTDIETRKAAGIDGIDGLPEMLSGKQAAGDYAAASHQHGYLPLAGGTVTGSLGIGTAPATLFHVRLPGAQARYETPTGDARHEFWSGGGRIGLFGWQPGLLQFIADSGIAMTFATANVERLRIGATGTIRPGADATQALGEASRRWAQVYAASGAISTSDAREKKYIGMAPERWLDAWGNVAWRRYKFRASKNARGGRRWHVGLVAQDVHDAFAAQGIDAFAIGLLCRDDLEDGKSRWGLRYDECHAIEAMWQRREMARIADRLDRIEAAMTASVP